MESIRLLDEAQYDAQMRTVVLPALHAVLHEYIHPVDERVFLRCQLFPLPGSARCVVISHGFTESCEKFHEMAYYFLRQGYSVLLLDHRGHGLSLREVENPDTVYIRRFDDYVRDLDSAVCAARPLLPKGCRLVLFGHSMGGAIAARTLELHPATYEKCVLSAPMLAMDTYGVPSWAAKAVSGLFLAAGLGKRRFFGHPVYSPGEQFSQSACLSRARFDYYAKLRMAHPHLRTNAASYRWIWEGLRNHDRLFKPQALARICTPTLLLRAQHDSFVLPKALDDFESAVPCARLVDIPNVKHEIYRSPNECLLPYLKQIFTFLEA